MIKGYNLKHKIMKTKKTLVLSLAAILALGLMSFDVLYITGEADATGSPADGGADCTSCHADNAVNTGGGSVTITSSPSFTSGKYAPGTDYTMSVTVAKAGQGAFGFDFEALKASNTDGGTLAVLNGGTQIMAGGNATNMVHNGTGIGSGTFTFTFKWTAPAALTGAVTFYASGNATDDNGGPDGDFVYTTSLVVAEDLSIGIANHNNNSDIKVYPTVASDNISIINNLNESLNVIMFDLTGKVVMNSKGISASNNSISVLNMANGTYILKAYNEKGLVKSDRVVVMHK